MKRVFCVMLAAVSIFAYAAVYASGISEDISQGIVRFHILANSDSEYDQQVKLDVRDYVSKMLGGGNYDACSDEYIDSIENFANERLRSIGAPYSAKISVERVFIPRKRYKNIMLPAGRYNAARLILGDGKGRNWWCVAYPPLCFTEDTEGALSARGEDILKEQMSEEAFEMITADAEYRFWIVDMVGKILH